LFGLVATFVDMPAATKLSSTVTVSQYQSVLAELEAAVPPHDVEFKRRIAKFFVERFRERYISPINAAHKETKHGFCTMAVSCLMIEALESFWRGWPDTKNKRSEPFLRFFERTAALSAFVEKTEAFYKHVRCGILHQGETTDGWTIHRNGPLLKGKSINATELHKVVACSLKEHAAFLKIEDQTSERWRNFKTKMKHVCENC
jgi:hypothetical protein